MLSTDEYFVQLRASFDLLSDDKNPDTYIDLAKGENLAVGELVKADAPPDRLMSFQEIMMKEISNCNLDRVKIGINELLKHLLITIETETEQETAECYLYRLRMIFKRCLMPDFPFAKEIWDYICDCLKWAGSILIEGDYFIAAKEVIESLSNMGRTAAINGLPTSCTQSSLRILENKSLRKDQLSLASMAKNARFNLET